MNWWRGPESNWGHRGFQPRALPPELPRQKHPPQAQGLLGDPAGLGCSLAGTTGFEPAISGVTIRCPSPA